MFKNWRDWLTRFVPAEVAGIAGSYAGYLLVADLGVSPILAAYGAAFGENCGYYTVVFLRDWFALPQEKRQLVPVLKAMVHDFGIAEVLDSFIVRPGFTVAAVALFGQGWGVGIAKFAADAVFYLLAIFFWEKRRARENAEG
ncbi:hypothetical protein A6F68_01693 [Tsuneonella dongtanensis]|uniref:GtrA-like protein n=1 Tax=Tsuneonella dongtanensis TaxID=692370 RepID=A0A1B2ADI3_9SPHN|nr:hypothetical protein [Tsuneonella dongtanensis]ANY20206.1 hypothetical protein A6F68_01693 [Tsuneonella dongtanensis]